MNSLTRAEVLAEDKLFATLDTRTRRWTLPNWGPVLLSDTVGFIRDLPHSLIASFKATLEETRQADLLIHVADASSPTVSDQITAVYDVLQELGIEEKDTLLVLNKVDRIKNLANLDSVLNRYPNAVPVSAKTKLGFEKLHSVVSDALSRSFQDVDIEMHVSNGKLLAYIAAKGEILSTQYGEDMVTVHCRLPQKYLGRIDPTDTIITPHSPAGWINSDEQENTSESADDNGALSNNDNPESNEAPLPPASTLDVTESLRPDSPNGVSQNGTPAESRNTPPPSIPIENSLSIEPELPLDDTQ